MRGVVGADARGRLAGDRGGVIRLLQPAGRFPVPGKLGCRGERARVGEVRSRGERRGERLVEGAAAARHDLAPGDLGEQHVADPERARDRVRQEHLRGPELADRVGQGIREGPEDLGEQRLLDRPAGDRDRPEHLARRRRQVAEPHGEDPRERRGWQAGGPARRGRGRCRRSDRDCRSSRRRQQLLGEERVAVGAAHHALEELGRRAGSQDRLELARYGVRGQRRELQPGHARVPRQLCEPVKRRVAGREILGSGGEHQQHPLAVQVADKEGHEVTAGPIDPVDVLDREQCRRHRTHPLQQPDHALVQPSRWDGRLGRQRRVDRLGWDELGDDAREVRTRRTQQPIELARAHAPSQAPERLDERQVREAVTEVETATDHRPAAARADTLSELGDQPRLADPGFAADDHDRGTPLGSLSERAIELGEVRVAPDEHGARDTPHPADGTAG